MKKYKIVDNELYYRVATVKINNIYDANDRRVGSFNKNELLDARGKKHAMLNESDIIDEKSKKIATIREISRLIDGQHILKFLQPYGCLLLSNRNQLLLNILVG